MLLVQPSKGTLTKLSLAHSTHFQHVASFSVKGSAHGCLQGLSSTLPSEPCRDRLPSLQPRPPPPLCMADLSSSSLLSLVSSAQACRRCKACAAITREGCPAVGEAREHGLQCLACALHARCAQCCTRAVRSAACLLLGPGSALLSLCKLLGSGG